MGRPHLVALVLLAGCGGSTRPAEPELGPPGPEPSAAQPPPLRAGARRGVGRKRVGRPTRPLLLETRLFDPQALPRAQPLPAEALGPRGWFSVTPRPGGYFLAMGRDLVSEVEIESPQPFRVFVGPRLASGRPAASDPPCGANAQGGSPRARWRGIAKESLSANAVELEEYEGVFDSRRCRARATRGWTVRPTPVVSGVLYAFRAADRDEVVLVAPPAEWVSATLSPSEQLAPHVGTLTIVALPLEKGGSAAAQIVVGPDGLDTFDALRSSRTDSFLELARGAASLALRVDVVWPDGDEGPSGVIGISGVPAIESAGRGAPSPRVQ